MSDSSGRRISFKKQTICLLVALLLSGCIMIDTKLQLPDPNVKPTLTGEDCVSILGFGIGTVRMGEAMQGRHFVSQPGTYGQMVRVPDAPIRRIHSVLLKESTGLFFGQRCLEVTGEP